MTYWARRSLISFQANASVPIIKSDIWLSIMLFSIIIGCRYMVGVDYKGYLEDYRSGIDGYAIRNYELAFKCIVTFLLKIDAHYIYFFIISAFVQIYFFYKSFDRKIYYLLPWAVPIFLMTELGSLENGIRHFTALMIFFYSLKYIRDSLFGRYVLTIGFASLFHLSVLVCLPLYWLLRCEIFKNIGIQLFGIMISIFVSEKIVTWINDYFGGIIFLLGYDGYLSELNKEGEGGLGFYVSWFINILIIFLFPQLYKKYKHDGFIVYWNLFYIGLLLKPATDFILVLGRINWYFYKIRFLIFAFVLHYLYCKCKENDFFYFLFFMFLLSIIIFFLYEVYVGANQMSPFYFFWQETEYVPVHKYN